MNFYMSDKDLAAFFKNAGYETEMKQVEQHLPAYHNRVEPIKFDKLHVKINGQLRPADEVYGEVMRLRMVTPDPTTIKLVNEILNND